MHTVPSHHLPVRQYRPQRGSHRGAPIHQSGQRRNSAQSQRQGRLGTRARATRAAVRQALVATGLRHDDECDRCLEPQPSSPPLGHRAAQARRRPPLRHLSTLPSAPEERGVGRPRERREPAASAATVHQGHRSARARARSSPVFVRIYCGSPTGI